MKKMLVLVLVLSLASALNAAIVGDLTGSSNVGAGSVSLNITGGGDIYMVITSMGSAVLTPSLGAAAPPDSALAGMSMADLGLAGTYGNGDIWGMANISGNVYNNGAWLNIAYSRRSCW